VGWGIELCCLAGSEPGFNHRIVSVNVLAVGFAKFALMAIPMFAMCGAKAGFDGRTAGKHVQLQLAGRSMYLVSKSSLPHPRRTVGVRCQAKQVRVPLRLGVSVQRRAYLLDRVTLRPLFDLHVNNLILSKVSVCSGFVEPLLRSETTPRG
jgi:hypothetical protein